VPDIDGGAPALGIAPGGNGHDAVSAARRRHHVDTTTHEVQAAAEGVGEIVAQDRIEFLGEHFWLASRVGLMPLLKFSNAANKGVDSADPVGLGAMYSVIRDCIVDVDPDTREPIEASLKEWARFEELAIEAKADDRDLLDFVNKAIAVVTARPRSQPGSSSAGPPTTSPGSKASPTSPDTEELKGLVPVDSLLDR
jgi:hypothetical protein